MPRSAIDVVPNVTTGGRTRLMSPRSGTDVSAALRLMANGGLMRPNLTGDQLSALTEAGMIGTNLGGVGLTPSGQLRAAREA